MVAHSVGHNEENQQKYSVRMYVAMHVSWYVHHKGEEFLDFFLTDQVNNDAIQYTIHHISGIQSW